MSTRTLPLVLVVAVLVGASVLLLYHLGVEPLQDYDEATYAEVTAESLASHDFLTFTVRDHLYFNKPPLLFWLMGASASFVPDHELGNRLPSALSGILLIGLMMLLVYEVTRSVGISALGGIILETTSAFIEPARQARFDVLVSLFIMLSVYVYMRAQRIDRERGKVGTANPLYLAFGIALGLAILTKGPLVIYALAAILGVQLIYRRSTWLRDPYLWGGAAACAAIVLPWHIYETVLFGKAFWDTYVFGQVVSRVQQNLFVIGPTNGEYLLYVFEFACPWAYAFCVGVIATPFLWGKMDISRRAAILGALFGAASVLLVCFVTKTKAFSYLIPLYPFMALLCVVVLCEVLRRYQDIRVQVLALSLSVGMASIGLYLSIFSGFHINAYYAAEVSLAYQERDIGNILKSSAAPTFYVYDTTTLGSIMYYSRLLQPLAITVATDTPSGSYVVYPSKEEHAADALLTQGALIPLYTGATISLGRIAIPIMK